jgi:hypothetical protein
MLGNSNVFIAYALPKIPYLFHFLCYKIMPTELDAINARFNADLQMQIDGVLPIGHVYQLGMPGKILQSMSMPCLPIEMTSQRLSEKSQKRGHEFDMIDIRDLPQFLNNPMGMFAYGDSSKAINVITEIDKNGKKFLVGVALNPEIDGRHLEINSIRSIFPKHSAEWLNWIVQGKALYLHKEQIKIQIEQQRTILADVLYLDLAMATKVVINFDNPKFLS